MAATMPAPRSSKRSAIRFTVSLAIRRCSRRCKRRSNRPRARDRGPRDLSRPAGDRPMTPRSIYVFGLLVLLIGCVEQQPVVENGTVVEVEPADAPAEN